MPSEPDRRAAPEQKSKPLAPLEPGWLERVGLRLAKRVLEAQGANVPALLQGDTDANYRGLRAAGPPGRWRRFFSADSDLERYRLLEEWSWKTESSELQNLAWLLHAKHEDSVLRARQSNGMGSALVVLASVLALADAAGAACGWLKIMAFVKERRTGDEVTVVIPEHFWTLVVATTGLVLLIGAAATILFNAASRFYVRAAAYAQDADHTRQLESAVRIVLAAPGDSRLREAFIDLAIELVKPHQRAAHAHVADIRSPIEPVANVATAVVEKVGGKLVE